MIKLKSFVDEIENLHQKSAIYKLFVPAPLEKPFENVWVNVFEQRVNLVIERQKVGFCQSVKFVAT